MGDKQTMLDLTKQLIQAESISPSDAGCQTLISQQLVEMGFVVEHLPFGEVSNLWACHGEGPPYFVFAGHTDVVPPGPLSDWQTPPFKPTLIGDKLFGRGSADMKGSLAAMLTATRRFLASFPGHSGTLAFLITSDEEADAINGTRKVIEELQSRQIDLNWCLIGEPSSSQRLGDVIRTGRRGSLHANLRIIGIQGHVAYPDEARNPIHKAMPALTELVEEVWDEGNEYFPPTSMQISNIHSGTGVTNVIPGELELLINFRFSTESTQIDLQRRTKAILDRHGIQHEISWTLSGDPFLTVGGELIAAVQQSLRDIMNIETELSTSGGTSDGRFIAPAGAQVVELGPCNSTIHKVNENVSVEELAQLADVYQQILNRLLCH
ncbi:MAG: succinyl-diaminopimelate desuccinylase [bacterium]|nr:succinyl-diaminopimelate desuccinylase [Gammaproteobacteria bacterium]HIL98554.1 succinyl-diaminopimelate desuccinylase [Pseudomonadales bacterium]